MKIVSSARGIHSPEFHKKKRRQRNVRIGWSVVFIIIFIAIPTYLLRTQRFLITTVEVEGNSMTKTDEIEQTVMDKIAGKYIWLFPRANGLIYPKGDIKKTLLQNIPRLSSVEVALSNPQTLVVSVVEREPFALYCTDITIKDNPTGCFFLDKTGYIFSEAPAFSGGVYFVYTSDPSLEIPLRKQFLNSATFSQISPFVSSLGQIGLSPKVFIDKNNEYELVLSSGGVVRWKAGTDLELVLSNLTSLITAPSFFKGNNSINNILYIEMGDGNKFRYKFRDV